MYKPKTLQNVSGYSKENPTVQVSKDSPDWSVAYNNWIQGKNPTDSPEWKKGVFLLFEFDSTTEQLTQLSQLTAQLPEMFSFDRVGAMLLCHRIGREGRQVEKAVLAEPESDDRNERLKRLKVYTGFGN